MNRYSTLSQLKAIAREQLFGKYLPLSSTYLILYLLRNFVTAPAALLTMPSPFGHIAYYVIEWAITLFFAIFQVGISYIFLSNACGQHPMTGNLYIGFTMGPLKAISIWLIPSLLLALPTFIPNIALSLILELKGQRLLCALAVWICIVLPLCSLICLLIRLPYALCFYIMLDFPDMEAKACRRYSVKLMKGNKWRYFKLQLSFIPFYILSFFTFGIGMLYILPYKAQTTANFYLDLMQVQDTPAI